MMLTWYEGMGRFSLEMTAEQAMSCSGPGAQDDNVAALAEELADQLNKLSSVSIRAALREYGAWDEEELADIVDNLHRLVWVAACDLAEEYGAWGDQ